MAEFSHSIGFYLFGFLLVALPDGDPDASSKASSIKHQAQQISSRDMQWCVICPDS
jgi:hypothetical protein